ncbi:MAG: endonuclease III [Methanobacteriaceae archaeon]|nr:endonuclease III [Methanobacteriaceae archaeon]
MILSFFLKEVAFISKSIEEIVDILLKNYKLRVFEDGDPYRVLIRTILSQRTRDENTDIASANLFSKFHTLEEVANADVEEIQPLIKKAGFYRVKSQRIKEISQILIDEYHGTVPRDINELLKLPGVGRKTANCVLVYGFKEAAIPVDVHVHRISNRLGLVNTEKPDDTEIKLKKVVPKDLWIDLNDLLVQFGQDICRPIKPQHDRCPIKDYCDYYKEINNN